MRVWEIDVSRTSTAEVLRWCMSEGADRFLVAIRMHRGSRSATWLPSIDETAVQQLLGANFIECLTCTGWPGTALINHPGRVFVASLDEALVSRLAEREPVLGRWLHRSTPELPEDLCAFRSTGTAPTLVTVTHECDGWVITQGATRPRIKGITSNEVSFDILRDYVFDGPCFCRLWRGRGQARIGRKQRSPSPRRR